MITETKLRAKDGSTVNLTRAAVALAALETPSPVEFYSVQIGNVDHPVKELVSRALGDGLEPFNSHEAAGAVHRLGFEVRQKTLFKDTDGLPLAFTHAQKSTASY